MPTAQHVHGTGNVLGEGPVWHTGEQALYWVDIVGQTVNRLDPSTGATASMDVETQISVLARREAGGWVAAGAGGFYELTADGSLSPIADPEEGKPDARFNDGKVDRAGRFWAGTMTPTGASSSIYRLDPDLSVSVMASGYTISNGIAWNADDSIVYIVDSMAYTINAYDYDPATGDIDNKRPLTRFQESDGIPDGLTADINGNLWCAMFGGSSVLRIDPSGQVVEQVDVPARQPTSCTFGGGDLDVLYITSARYELPAEILEQPDCLEGDVFSFRPELGGRPEPLFAG